MPAPPPRAHRPRAAASKSADGAPQPIALRKGTLVPQGTVLGRVSLPEGASDGHLQFAIRPAGDSADDRPPPDPLKLGRALHRASPPRGQAVEPLPSHRLTAVRDRKEPPSVADPLRPRHHGLGLLALTDRLRGDRRTRARPDRVPLPLRSEAHDRHPALRSGRLRAERLRLRRPTRATPSRSPT